MPNSKAKQVGVSESELADRRYAMMEIVGQLIPGKKYVRLVSEGAINIVDGAIVATESVRYEIREFMDSNPDSENVLRLHFPAELQVIEYGLKTGMLTFTDLGKGHTRYRLTLNTNTVGRVLAGA